MILVASSRAGGAGLAAHLMNVHDNEHVEIHELRDFVSDDLHGAFKEAQAIARATKCEKFLFSLSLNPPQNENVPVADFEDAIERVEKRLGLAGHPRAIVFHEKEGRRHAHCVWSRIDAATMTARKLPYYKMRLQDISRELYLDHDWEMPHGLIDRALSNPLNFTLAEWQQAKRSGRHPRITKAAIQKCWQASDSPSTFSNALAEHGFHLAKGDRRSHVVVDSFGEVHSLSRALNLKAKDVRARLGTGDELKPVATVLEQISGALKDKNQALQADARESFNSTADGLLSRQAAMTRTHREQRSSLRDTHKERSKLEAQARAAKLPRGIQAVWSFITGETRKIKTLNNDDTKLCFERDRREREALIFRQLSERRLLQKRIKAVRSHHAQTLLGLREEQRHLRGLVENTLQPRKRNTRKRSL